MMVNANANRYHSVFHVLESEVDMIRIVLIGAGSQSFGPASIRDVLVSEVIRERGAELVLMDIAPAYLARSEQYARLAAEKLNARSVKISATTELERALEGADFAITAIEVNRFLYWTQDFHIPRQFGFKQVFGENGGPGGGFHALRNIPPTLKIAREMEKRSPHGWILNYTNPEHWLIEAISRLTRIKSLGLCHGVFMGMEQIARLLDKPVDQIEFSACGMNHFSFFQIIRDKATGADLYPELRKREAGIDLLYDWHDMGLSRIFFRRFGLWPSPASNHIGEYLQWADEYVASNLQLHYDPATGHPWKGGDVPEFVYHIGHVKHDRPKHKPVAKETSVQVQDNLRPSGELAIPFIEGMACGKRRDLPAINLPNNQTMPGLDDGAVVEVPAVADAGKLLIEPLPRLPEAILAMLRTQASIRKIGIEAYQELSKDKLLQAILLDPITPGYRQAIAMVDTMLELQKEVLPAFKWSKNKA